MRLEEITAEREKAEEVEYSDCGCAVKNCPNIGIYDYDGYVDQYGVLHMKEGVVSTPICASHFRRKQRNGTLAYGTFAGEGVSHLPSWTMPSAIV